MPVSVCQARLPLAMQLSLVACLAATLYGAAQSKPLTLISTAWPPFTNADGRPRFALDLARRHRGAGIRLFALHVDRARTGGEGAIDDRLLRRRQYLQRLSERSRKLQGHRSEVSRSTPLYGQYFQVHLVNQRGERLLLLLSSAETFASASLEAP